MSTFLDPMYFNVISVFNRFESVPRMSRLSSASLSAPPTQTLWGWFI
jgi:hypothetical protein